MLSQLRRDLGNLSKRVGYPPQPLLARQEFADDLLLLEVLQPRLLPLILGRRVLPLQLLPQRVLLVDAQEWDRLQVLLLPVLRRRLVVVEGVHQGDLLIATEATYSGSTTFSTPTDSLGNTWTADGGGVYCSAYDCVEIWHAVANSNGLDTVTFHTSASSSYTYGFLREFVGYTGTVDKSAKNSGTSGTPSVTSFSPASGDLVVGVAAETVSGWQTGQYYYMIGDNTGWFAATEIGPGWTNGSTTAPWAAPSGGDWAELVVAYSPP